MQNWKLSVGVLAAGAVGYVAGVSAPWKGGALAVQPDKATQPEKKPAPGAPGQPDMEAMMKVMQPGPEHKVLDVFIGDFAGSVKMWMAPGAPPMESKGTISRKWEMDGRFVVEHVDGDAMGGGPDTKPFKAMGAMGYNTIEKRYEAAWIENMSTNIATSNGTYDAKTKTFTFTGDCYDPMTMKRTRHRTVIDVSNPDRELMTAYGPGPDGKEFKNFEGVFERTGKK